MRIEITYYAVDDTEFDSKQECEAYEKELENRFNSVQFFDEDCKPIPNALDKIEAYAFFIRVHDAMNAQRLFHWLTYQCSFQEPECSYDRGDVLHWDVRHDCWENLTRERERIANYIRRVEGR